MLVEYVSWAGYLKLSEIVLCDDYVKAKINFVLTFQLEKQEL